MVNPRTMTDTVFQRLRLGVGGGWLALRLAGSEWVLAMLCLVSACRPNWQTRDFVGTWVSSRTYTPVYITDNGEWEIRNGDGAVLQYGVWQLKDRYLVWGILRNGSLYKDPTQILAVEADSFRIREQDGSVTVFRRYP